MSNAKMGKVIAERPLIWKRPGHSAKRVIVRIGIPQRTKLGRYLEYRCPYQISGYGSYEKIHFIFGIDAVQSILLTFRLMGKILGDFKRGDGSTLSWSGARDCGFPIMYWRLSPKERIFSRRIRRKMHQRILKGMREIKD